MSPIAFFVLVIITVLGCAALSQIPLVQDAIANTGFAPSEVWAGIAAILLVFYTAIAIFSR